MDCSSCQLLTLTPPLLTVKLDPNDMNHLDDPQIVPLLCLDQRTVKRIVPRRRLPALRCPGPQPNHTHRVRVHRCRRTPHRAAAQCIGNHKPIPKELRQQLHIGCLSTPAACPAELHQRLLELAATYRGTLKQVPPAQEHKKVVAERHVLVKKRSPCSAPWSHLGSLKMLHSHARFKGQGQLNN